MLLMRIKTHRCIWLYNTINTIDAKQLKRYGVPMQARNNQNQTVADVAALKIREEIIYGGNEGSGRLGSGAKKMLDLLQMPFASGVHR